MRYHNSRNCCSAFGIAKIKDVRTRISFHAFNMAPLRHDNLMLETYVSLAIFLSRKWFVAVIAFKTFRLATFEFQMLIHQIRFVFVFSTTIIGALEILNNSSWSNHYDRINVMTNPVLHLCKCKIQIN